MHHLTGFFEPPLSGGLDIDSRSSGCARLGGGVGPPLGVVVEEVAVLVVLVRRFGFTTKAAIRNSHPRALAERLLPGFAVWRFLGCAQEPGGPRPPFLVSRAVLLCWDLLEHFRIE